MPGGIDDQQSHLKDAKRLKINEKEDTDVNVASPSSEGQEKANGTKFVYDRNQGLRGMLETEAQNSMDITTEDQAMENEWHQVQRARDRRFVAVAPAAYLFGEIIRDKTDELAGVLLLHKVHYTEGPTKIKMATGDAAFKIAVETEEELSDILEIIVNLVGENEEPEMVQLFTRMDNHQRESEIERTVEVYGLHPLTTEARIRSAMNKFGQLETKAISTRPCTKGYKITAKVIFKNAEDVQKIMESGRKRVFVGTQLARLRKVGNEMVEWDIQHIAKLSGLPWRTTELDLLRCSGKARRTSSTSRTSSKEAGSTFSNAKHLCTSRLKKK